MNAIKSIDLNNDRIIVQPIFKPKVTNLTYPTETTSIGTIMATGSQVPMKMKGKMVLVDISMNDKKPDDYDTVLNGEKVYILKMENIIGEVTI